MPHMKRTQESSGSDEDQSDSGQESYGVAFPLHPRKRPRTSNSPSERDEEASDAESNPRSSPLADDDNMSLDDDELELRQTQIIQEKYAHLVDEANVPSDHGILERVDCYNFMCHDHFSVELGPLINFIIGKNGSGKSAILTALTLCLGGKASATNRGQSLKNFIKEGKENSNIVVRIKNQGDGAYRPEVYGKSIIVERHFNKSGNSGFKIKSDNGHIVSTKKAELDSITDYFSLQIDNPMNVLSQDSARQFLSTSSPAEKYKFFVKGVQLEQLDQDYCLIEESVDQMEEKIRNKSQDIRILEQRWEAAQKKLELSEQHASLRERIKHLRNQLAWAQVEEQERIRDSLNDELAKADGLIGSAETALVDFDVKFQAIETEAETAAEHALEADRLQEQARQELADLTKEMEGIMAERRNLQAQKTQIKDLITSAEERISESKGKIDDENRRLAEVSDGGYAKKQDECKEAKSRASEAREEHNNHLEGSRDLREKLLDAQKQEKHAKEQLGAKQADLSQAEERLHGLQRENGQRRTGFHDKLPSLKQAIARETSFTMPPLGPVGEHITLLEAKWASILEHAFGNTLNSFIVASKQDSTTLLNIMRRVNCVCPILIGRDGNIDISAHVPDSQYQTALDILQFDNSMVRQQLIISHSVEQMVLIESLEEASAALFDGERPKNVKRCFCINLRDRRRGHTLSYNRMGDPSQAPVPIYQGNPRMKSDAASQISAQREVVGDLARQLNELKQEFQSARSHVQACNQAMSRWEKTEHELKLRMQRMEDDAEALRDALEKENAEDGHLETLLASLKDAEDEKQLNEGSLNDSEAAMTEVMGKIKVGRSVMVAKNNEITRLTENSRVAESERSVVAGRRQDILGEKNAAVAQIEKQKADRRRLHVKLEGLVERVLEYIEKASLVSTRIPVDEGESSASLDQKLTKLHADLTRYHQQLGASRDEIAAEANQTEIAYRQATSQIEEHTAIVQQLKDTLHDRKKRWEIFRSHISSRAKAQFTYLLSERSFRGRLLTDHNNKLLDLQVEPDITKDDSTGRGARTLSGGEKSFSQVCLLLALWEAMGSPIRCLDEFDVYMDHINRKMAIDMLMTAARRSIGRQFILITPGSKTDITISPDVRVKELAEPERGQTTLSFQRR
ncbi:hypothetical protein N7478_001503 [Penicillium angulare]|uniref:uncharacterized protein n=1 Tax=Penicillium angulare TaxID=116970 RepID=UPI00253F7DF0|nr:uncharacterized protein N7478_001503 [Penicillium angulare]KAJ5288473.1 hypothetical protein N7478_001503 [Penicillium angulare]